MFEWFEHFTFVVTSPEFVMFMAGAMSGLLVVTYAQSWVLMMRRARKAKDEFRTSVLGRLDAGIEVTAADLDRFCNAHGLDKASAKLVLDRIYAERPAETEPGTLDRLRPLLEEVEKNQPYDHLPVEVRPSLVRLDSLVGDSADGRDRAVLGPILAALNEYVDLAKERRRLNLHRNVALAMGVVSLVVGGATLYLTPSEEELASSVASELTRMAAPPGASDAATEQS